MNKQTITPNIKQNQQIVTLYKTYSNLIEMYSKHWNSSLDSYVVMIIVSHTCIKNDF